VYQGHVSVISFIYYYSGGATMNLVLFNFFFINRKLK